MQQAITAKQGKETALTKRLVRNMTSTMKLLPEQKEHFKAIFEAVQQAEQGYGEQLRTMVKPVTHTLAIEPIPAQP